MRTLEQRAIHVAAVSLARDVRSGRFLVTERDGAYVDLDEVVTRAQRLGAPKLTRNDVLHLLPAQAHGLCAATAIGRVPSIAARLDDLAREATATTDAPPPRAA